MFLKMTCVCFYAQIRYSIDFYHNVYEINLQKKPYVKKLFGVIWLQETHWCGWNSRNKTKTKTKSSINKSENYRPSCLNFGDL